jgi:carbon-monoxide dehydrogenase small subunit/xanthine dehydrogenase YagT iron-sulfur-binding subunit
VADGGVTRRRLIQSAAASALALPAAGNAKSAVSAPADNATRRSIHLTVNGVPHSLAIETRRTLAEVIRNELGLTGTKVVCDHASCGACTVLLDGRAVFSCHLLAAQADGKSVVTIEGLAEGEKLHPLQRAFIDFDATQCGFCTPGMIMALKAALDRNPRATAADIKQSISGNLCRCAAYPHIVAAAVAAAGRLT